MARIKYFTGKFLLGLLTINITFFGLQKTYGWGAIGHDAVWDIAYQLLTPDAKRVVDDLLSNLSPIDLTNVANFPDVIRRSSGWEHTASYHYADVPKGADYLENLQKRIKAVQSASNDPIHLSDAGDVILTILRAQDILRDSSPNVTKSDKADALKFLIHMTGDAHQPLHVGYPEDKGGNLISDGMMMGGVPAKWNGRPANLHETWDEIILGVSYQKEFGGLKPAAPEAAKIYAGLLGKPSGADIAKWTADLSPGAWAWEYRNYLDTIYTGYKDLDTYIPAQKDIVDLRIKQAGVRLAVTLNNIFGSNGPSIGSTETAFRAQVSAVLTSCSVSLEQIARLKREAPLNAPASGT
ncbi:MAG: Nuclease [Bacteriovoracaceae bacterium]|nr:Nuclease [Bacteriovoracaceae bacterium]